MHWADQASLEAIAHLLRHPPSAAVLLALSYRTGQASPILLDALASATREGRAVHLALDTLSEEQTIELLDGEVAAHRRWIFQQSGGNPFYIDAPLRASSLDALQAASSSRVEFGGGIPATVQAAIAEELRRLPPQTRRLLEGAAVTGEPFDPELAAETADLAPERALELLDELVAGDWVALGSSRAR